MDSITFENAGIGTSSCPSAPEGISCAEGFLGEEKARAWKDRIALLFCC